MFQVDSNIIESLRHIEYQVKIVIIILILLLNGTVVVSFMKMKKPSTQCTSNILLLNQALADSTICIPLIKELLPMQIYIEIWEHAHALAWYTDFVSLASILLCTFDRYLNINNPSHWFNLNTNKRVVIAILSVWLLSAIPAVATAITISITHAGNAWIHLRRLRLSLFIISLIMVIMVIMTLLLSVRSLNKKKREQHDDNQPYDRRRKMAAHDRMIKILMAMVFLHTFTSSPVIVNELVTHAHDRQIPWLHVYVAWLVTYFLYAVRSVINPLFTVLLKKDYWYVLTAHACCRGGELDPRLLEEMEEEGCDDDVIVSMMEIEENILET